jgi:cytochrome c
MRVRMMQRAGSYLAAVVVIVAVVAGVALTLGIAPSAAPDGLNHEGTYAYKARPAGLDGPLARCVVCHSVEPGGALRVAPTIYGIVGARKARESWYGYSEALKAAGGTWSAEDLDKFLASPSAYLPGTRMSIIGIPDAKQRADIIAALKAAR